MCVCVCVWGGGGGGGGGGHYLVTCYQELGCCHISYFSFSIMPMFKYNSVINISTTACACHIDCEFTHACYIMRCWFHIVCQATVARCNNNRSPWALFVWSILPIVAGAWCTLHLNILYHPTLIMRLTHWGWATHMCQQSNHHWFR